MYHYHTSNSNITYLLHQYFPLIEKVYIRLYNSNMKEYFSHSSAAIMWNIPCIEDVLGYKIKETGLTHITVPENNARFRSNGKKVHSCELALPAGAIITRNGSMVASPELLFLELASELSIHRLILLGLQLCSYPSGLPSEAITKKQKINAFLEKTAGHRGQRNAIRAMKYVENGSASIMESLAYMILALPRALGGYGLNGSVFNHEIKLKSEARIHLGQNVCYADMYYKKAKLDVEYDSFAYHSSPKEQAKDAVRSVILERQGIAVVHLSTFQLYDRNACMDFAYSLAARLGKRINTRTKSFDEMHALLRNLLPEGKAVLKS